MNFPENPIFQFLFWLVDTPGLAEIDGAERVRVAAETAKDADLVLVVVDGPLRESEHDLLEHFGRMEKRVLICLNKSDWYDNRDRDALIGLDAAALHPADTDYTDVGAVIE